MALDNIATTEIVGTDEKIDRHKKKNPAKLIKLIISILVVLILLTGLGVAAFVVTQVMEPKVPEYEPIEVIYNNNPGTTTNLSNYEDIYLRFQFSLVFHVNKETKNEEYAAKIAYIEEYNYLIQSATISSIRSMTRRQLIHPDAPRNLCDALLNDINQSFYELKGEETEYGLRTGFDALVGKDNLSTIAARAKFERLSEPKEMQFSKCYHTDYIIQ